MKYFIKTFGCQQNVADSERIAQTFAAREITETKNCKHTNYVIINTCMVRKSAENRVYGLVENLKSIKKEKIAKKQVFKIIVTGCMTGMAVKDKTGKYLNRLKNIMPEVDEFMPIEEVGFDHEPLRSDEVNSWIPISNGCNNYCTYCVVPYTRGHEISRPYEEIVKECKHLKIKGYKNITLLGQNVNSYGSDFLITKLKKNQTVISEDTRFVRLERCTGTSTLTEQQNVVSSLSKNKNIKPVYVKHLGKNRIPTLFPHLLEEVAKLGFEKVDFISSNPWDFSDELIEVIANNKNITRTVHLPLQSGDTNVLKRMNRWYTSDEYLNLVANLKLNIKNLKLTTDIIVGFCGETDQEFQNTVDLCKKVDFEKAYVAMYSPRPMTYANKKLKDNIPHKVKKLRWQILENLINKPKLKHKLYLKKI